MVDQSNLPVPLLRETVFVPPANGGRSTAARAASRQSLFVFLILFVPGALAAAVFKSTGFFLLIFLVSMLVTAAFYFLRTQLSRPSLSEREQLVQRGLQLYQPFLAKMHMGGFEAAAECVKAVVRSAALLHASHNQMFNIADESLAFYVSRLVGLADAKRLIGDERDLKRRFERLQDRVQGRITAQVAPSATEAEALRLELQDVQGRLDRLEVLNRAALQMTADLQKLRSESEWQMVHKVAGEESNARARAYLAESLDRERRVAEELSRLGL